MDRKCAIAGAALLAFLCALAPARIHAQAYQSAVVCAECHAEIHRTWRGSEHATAFTDPAFRKPYDRLRRENPRRALTCERCHNPMRDLLSGGDPRAAIFSGEGVTCDFCHSVSAVDVKGPFPRYRAKAGVKYSPHPGRSEKGPHRVQFSPLLITAEFCAGCHEYRNEHGVGILTTVSEWEKSFYRGTGVHCQFCHLPELFDARFIGGKRKKGPLDHSMVGGRQPERLARSIPIQARLSVSAGKALVVVSVKNELVGHATPTGIPTRRLRLAATLLDAKGNTLGRMEETFERVVGDGSGKPLTRAEDICTSARQVLKDNRILPKETREVRFSFPAGNPSPAAAAVSLTYENTNADASPGRSAPVTIVANRVIPVESGRWYPRAAAFAAAAALAIMAWRLYGRVRKKRDRG